MNSYILICIVFINFLYNSEAYNGRQFFSGRPVDKYGMVRPPVPVDGQFFKSAVSGIYKQKVNHADPKDNSTFDQV